MSTENLKNKSFKADQLSKCPFTGAGTPAKFSAGRGQSVRDFWPNSLNLKILSQHSNPVSYTHLTLPTILLV